jgi:DNA helicase-2/ATP-dependent DNA helicase PcrA
MPHINEPTEEQKRIIEDSGNVVVTAKPGSGKTFTIVEKIKQISNIIYDYQGVIAISFTRKASHELDVRCKNSGAPRKLSFYGTIDNFYISQIIMPFSKHITNSLVQFEVKTSVKDVPEFETLSEIAVDISPENEKLLIKSLESGYVFLDICGETALFILNRVQEATEYLTSRYTHIFIDEYQDCGDIQHKIFIFLINAGLKGIAVGDVNQAIYAFSNRYPKYLISLITDPKFAPYEITKNHRCHQSISNYSLRLFNIKTKIPCEEKRVFKVTLNGDESSIAKAIGAYLPAIKDKYGTDTNNKIGILCRNNSSAQIVSQNLGLPCKLFMETELDRYNAYWARLFNDFLQCYYDQSIFKVDFVDRYINEESNYKTYQKALEIVDKLFDIADMELISNISEIIKLAKLIYPEYENIETIEVLKDVLSTKDKMLSYKPATNEEVNILSLHKSKGLEFDIVFHLDLYQWIMPPYKATEEDYEQALNLHYVGVTRAKKVCYIMQGTIRHRSDGVVKDASESELLYINNLQDFRIDVCWNKKVGNINMANN